MAVTTNYGFRYPLKGDTRGTALDIEHLAEDVDAQMATNYRRVHDDWALYVALREARRVAGLGSSPYLVSWPFSPVIGGGPSGSSVASSDQRLILIPQLVPAGEAIDGVQVIVSTTGVFTGNNFNGIGAYTFDGFTFTRVAISASNQSFWKASSTNSIPFTSQLAANATDQLLWAAMLYCRSSESTNPQLTGITLGDAGQKHLGPLGMYLMGSIVWQSQTSMPTTLTSGTSGFAMTPTNVPWLAFYRNYS